MYKRLILITMATLVSAGICAAVEVVGDLSRDIEPVNVGAVEAGRESAGIILSHSRDTLSRSFHLNYRQEKNI